MHTSNEILTFLVLQGGQNEPKRASGSNPTCALLPSRFHFFASGGAGKGPFVVGTQPIKGIINKDVLIRFHSLDSFMSLMISGSCLDPILDTVGVLGD